ncbi:MAG: hypothetical protein JNL82_12845 [Myxococcales bacterium]|nr:hypothetical protein [Myxococcales bacterium]
MIAGFERDEILHEALVTPRSALVPFPGVTVIERPGWFQLISPPFRDGGLNEVSRAQLADDEADAVIDATLAQYAAQGIRFKWVVTPSCRPLDLRERLARRGMLHRRCIVMAADIADITVPPTPDVTVEPVDVDNVDAFADVVTTGWDTRGSPLADLQRAQIADPARRHRGFLARIDGRPVGGANHIVLARSAYFVGAVVLPPFRGRGVYRALIAARLAALAAAGLRLVTIQALADTSAPILTRLGFVPVAELDVFANR